MISYAHIILKGIVFSAFDAFYLKVVDLACMSIESDNIDLDGSCDIGWRIFWKNWRFCLICLIYRLFYLF